MHRTVKKLSEVFGDHQCTFVHSLVTRAAREFASDIDHGIPSAGSWLGEQAPLEVAVLYAFDTENDTHISLLSIHFCLFVFEHLAS